LFRIPILYQHFLAVKLVFESDSLVQSLIWSFLFFSHDLIFFIFFVNFSYILGEKLRLFFPLLLESFDSRCDLILLFSRIIFWQFFILILMLNCFGSSVFVIIEKVCIFLEVSLWCWRFQQRVILCIMMVLHLESIKVLFFLIEVILFGSFI